MNYIEQVETDAQKIAAELGREWSDCGEYERETYRNEAQYRLDGDRPRNMDELP